jgi:hypothetical protein
MRENPDYYADLYATIEESAGALRKWLLNHEQADDFNAMGSAPDTAARRMMIYRAKPAFIQQLDELIAENMHAGLSHELLDLGTIHEVMFERSVEVPPAKTLSTMLERDGYEFVGRVRNHEGEVRRYYSKRVENFTSESGGLTYPDAEKVRQFLKARADEIDEL